MKIFRTALMSISAGILPSRQEPARPRKIGTRRRGVVPAPALAAALACVVLALSAGHALAQRITGPAGPELGPLRAQLWSIPVPAYGIWIRAVLYRPPGPGPFPLAVVNHGTTESEADRAQYAMPRFETLAGWLVQRGYAVLVPQRPGHGETGGEYYEGIVTCDFADFRSAAVHASHSIEAAVLFMMAYPFVRREPVLLIGHSAGAMGALALAGRRPPIASAVVVFAAGHGGRHDNIPNQNCAPARLIATIEEFGSIIRVPTLWLYAENDTYFGPGLSRRLAEGFRLRGGSAEYHLLPPSPPEGHFLVQSPDGVRLWSPPLARFLSRIE